MGAANVFFRSNSAANVFACSPAITVFARLQTLFAGLQTLLAGLQTLFAGLQMLFVSLQMSFEGLSTIVCIISIERRVFIIRLVLHLSACMYVIIVFSLANGVCRLANNVCRLAIDVCRLANNMINCSCYAYTRSFCFFRKLQV